MKKKYKYIEVIGNTILVKTPVPYKTIRQREHETLQDAECKEHDLNASCLFLYDCMRLLGISKKKAKEQEFTLNIATGEKVITAASKKGVSNQMYSVIKRYNW